MIRYFSTEADKYYDTYDEALIRDTLARKQRLEEKICKSAKEFVEARNKVVELYREAWSLYEKLDNGMGRDKESYPEMGEVIDGWNKAISHQNGIMYVLRDAQLGYLDLCGVHYDSPEVELARQARASMNKSVAGANSEYITSDENKKGENNDD